MDPRPLAYFQPSPVRGQLEPSDPTTKPGWRYLQCTDTPNELKVLLPPRTSQVYAYLLGQERRELAKGPDANWDRLLIIRHLKDRMIRKCTRLSRLGTVRRTTEIAFRTIHAPPDFTLKELEKWYKYRDEDDNVPSSFQRKANPRPKSPVAYRKSTVTAKHSHGTRATTSLGRPHRMTQSSMSRRSSATQSMDNPYDRLDQSLNEDGKPLPSVLDDESYVHVPSVHNASSYRGARVQREERRNVTSPDPLPHPYRPRDSVLEELHNQPPLQLPIPQVAGSPGPTFPIASPAPIIGEALEERSSSPSGRPRLLRKRSSLKRPSSRLSIKSVAWATDLDRQKLEQQKLRYESAVEDIEIAGDHLDSARTAHREELIILRDLHKNVSEIKNQIHLDEERISLQRQKLIGSEEAVRHQEERLRITFEQLEIQEGNYQGKVSMALEEAQRTLFSSVWKEEPILEEN